MSGMPIMRIDDILVHPRDNDLIIGTHGRGIYILDDITALQQMTQKVMDSEATLFDVRPGTIWQNDPRLGRYWGGSKLFRGANPAPGTAISYYLKTAPSGDVKLTISDYTGKVVRNIAGTNEAGLNRIQWNLRGDPPPRPAWLWWRWRTRWWRWRRWWRRRWRRRWRWFRRPLQPGPAARSRHLQSQAVGRWKGLHDQDRDRERSGSLVKPRITRITQIAFIRVNPRLNYSRNHALQVIGLRYAHQYRMIACLHSFLDDLNSPVCIDRRLREDLDEQLLRHVI